MITIQAEAPEAKRARLRSDVTIAARVLPTHYPLETFIAVNPLSGLETMPFEQAIRRAADLYGSPTPTWTQLCSAGSPTCRKCRPCNSVAGGSAPSS